ncbi:MAG: mismatch-specific DNA-glycosylase [Acidimicrobiales bacterium]
MAADAAHAMVQAVAQQHPEAMTVRCDLLDLPLRKGSVAGVWASSAHQHVAAAALPAALGELHRILPVGGRMVLTVFAGQGSTVSPDTDEFPGRLFTLWPPAALNDLLVGAGFDVESMEVLPGSGHVLRPHPPPQRSAPSASTGVPADPIITTAVRSRTLADSVGPGMRLLLCGLNPSIYSADRGVGFARPGNRFWPAMVAAGLTHGSRLPGPLLLARHRIGMTDLVKRATVAAAELGADEYATGLARVERLCDLLRPAAVGFVGLAGWRRATDRRAVAGWQDRRLGPAPVYLMPSTSGLNARTSLAEHTAHLRAAARGPV